MSKVYAANTLQHSSRALFKHKTNSLDVLLGKLQFFSKCSQTKYTINIDSQEWPYQKIASTRTAAQQSPAPKGLEWSPAIQQRASVPVVQPTIPALPMGCVSATTSSCTVEHVPALYFQPVHVHSSVLKLLMPVSFIFRFSKSARLM